MTEATLTAQAEALGAVADIHEDKLTNSYTVDVWSPLGKVWGTTGGHLLSCGVMGNGSKLTAKDRREYLEIAKGELDRAGLDDCGDPDCEHCQGDTE